MAVQYERFTMPNWCQTCHAVWGDLRELEKFKSRMEVAQKYIRTKSDFGRDWLGNVLVSMRLLPLRDVQKARIPDTLHCRGSLESEEFDIERLPEERGGHYYICFETRTAWDSMAEMWENVLRKFKTLQHVYVAEEGGCEYYVNTDESGMFFNERYIISYDLTGENARILSNPNNNCCDTEYLSESEADNWVRATFSKIGTMEELKSFASSFKPQNDDFLYVNEFERA